MSEKRLTRSVPFAVRRVESDRAVVQGIAYLALDPAEGETIPRAEADLRVDSWGTFMRLEELRAMAHKFLEYGRQADSQHDHGVIGSIVESYVTRDGDPTFPPNVWVASVKVHDPATLAALDDGTLTGFSIEVLARTRDIVVRVEGIAKPVTIGELYDTTPLFLSLVDRPAIGQPFAAITPSARAVHARRQQSNRTVHVVRCAREETTMPTDVTEKEEPKADEKNAEETAETEKHVERDTAERDKTIATIVARAGEHLTAARASEIVARTAERTDFAATWAEIAPRMRAWSSLFDAICLFESTCWEIRYETSDSAEMAALISKAGGDFATVVTSIMSELAGAASESRSEHVERAGRKISAARLEKIKGAHARAGEAVTALSELIVEVEGEADDAAETEQKAASTPPTAPETAPQTEERVDPVAELRASVEVLKGEVTTARAEAEKTRTELEESRKRVTSLETARPAPRGEGDVIAQKESAAETAKREADKEANWGRGTIFPSLK